MKVGGSRKANVNRTEERGLLRGKTLSLRKLTLRKTKKVYAMGTKPDLQNKNQNSD